MAENKEETSAPKKVAIKSDDSADGEISVKRKNTAFSGPFATTSDQLTDKAIDDIARSETEKAMKAEDEKIADEFVKKKTFKDKFKDWFHGWWDNPKKRYTVLGVSAFIFLFLTIWPVTRYGALNLVGFRGSADIIILDESTNQPLKNVDVTIRGQTNQTDKFGRASFEKLKLGSTEVSVKKIAYAENTSKQTIGLGGNQLSDIALTPVGSQYTFKIVDWLSNNPINEAEVSYGESSALSNEEGIAVLTIEPTDDAEIDTSLVAEDYRNDTFVLTTESSSENEVKMRVGEPSYFVSNRSGTYDVYKSYVGEDPEVIVQGSGNERNDVRFAVSPDRKYGLLVSTRDGNRNDDGYMYSGLYKINLETSQVTKLDESERIDLVGWTDGKLVYVKIADGASGKNPDRHRLIILNLEDDYQNQIASSNYFNDIVVTDNKIFFAPSDAYKDNPDAALFRSDSSGSTVKIHDSEVWTIFQSEFNELTFDAVGEWWKYQISEDQSFLAAGPPSERTSIIFEQGPENKYAWVDQRDGKGVLLLYNKDTNESDTVVSRSGLRHPIKWLSDKHIVYRVKTSDETADYIVNLEGGDSQKIDDVSDVSGTDRWYYYY